MKKITKILHYVKVFEDGGVEEFIRSLGGQEGKDIFLEDSRIYRFFYKEFLNYSTVFCFHNFSSPLKIFLGHLAGRALIFIHTDLERHLSISKKFIAYPWLVFLSLIGIRILYFSNNNFIKNFCLRSIKLKYITSGNHKAIEIKGSKKKIIFVGRWSPEKNFLELFEVVNHLEGNNFELLVYGNFPQTIIDKCASQKIKFMGYEDDKDKIYVSNAILVVPSIYESGPLVAIEALERGLPVITRQVGIFKDFTISNLGFDEVATIA
ncbi:MAG: glycosyltransferase family 4 protein, partial [Gammaproteobacteria bacterium]